jgi:hypothetical protein
MVTEMVITREVGFGVFVHIGSSNESMEDSATQNGLCTSEIVCLFEIWTWAYNMGK